MPGQDEAELLRLAGSLERGSEHPLAAAVLQATQKQKLKLSEVRDFQSVTGKGILATIEGNTTALGNQALLDELKIPAAELSGEAESLRQDGQTVMFLAVNGKAVGIIGVADPIKSSSHDAIRSLHEEGIQIVMLTGDSRTTAQAVARKIGIDDVEAEVLPDQKSEVVKRLQAAGHIVAMAGRRSQRCTGPCSGPGGDCHGNRD